MNPDTNRFEPLDAFKLLRPDGSPVPKHWSVFTVGEHVVIKDYTFQVAYVGETAILFEPVGPIVVNQPAGLEALEALEAQIRERERERR